MKTAYIEKPFKKFKNKAYCLQISLFNLFISSNLKFNLNFFDYNNWVNFYFNFFNLFEFKFIFNKKTDHAGFLIDITFLFFNFYFKIYDCRHWDDKKEEFKKY